MPIRADQLPAAMRKKLGLPSASTKKRGGVGEAALTDGYCMDCGTRFSKYTAFVKHSKESGHGHWRLDL